MQAEEKLGSFPTFFPPHPPAPRGVRSQKGGLEKVKRVFLITGSTDQEYDQSGIKS